ncbi:MAG: hypothetical protein LUG91_09755 [Ruminococcus sp.]|nr:hypothetical protein [Ruminococcus sp.]
MKRIGKEGAIAVAGAAAGAILTGLAVEIIFGLGTGLAGAALVVMVIAVAAAFGWLTGRQSRIRKEHEAAYRSGYRRGLEEKTLVIRQPGVSVSFRTQDRAAR